MTLDAQPALVTKLVREEREERDQFVVRVMASTRGLRSTRTENPMPTNYRSTRRSGIIAPLGFGLALAVAVSANAGVYTTTYTLNTPYTASTPQVTHVVVNWSTNLTTGVVRETDLTDWSIRLDGGGSNVYTDNVIVTGTVQSIGGVSRSVTGIMFQFNLGTNTAGEFDNMLTGSALSAATSTAYNIYSYLNGFPPPYSPLGLWSNGNEATRQLPGYSSVVTVPGPGACALLALAGTRKRRPGRTS